MKPTAPLTVFFLALIVFISFSCNEDEDVDMLEHSFTGVLSVEYSKGFPAYTSKASLNVDIGKDGIFTFTGMGDSDEFEAEDILYEDGKPATKIRITGTLVFEGAQGEVMISGNNEYAMIKVSSNLYVQMTVWAWDDELGWIMVLDLPHTQQDKYSDGPLQFNFQDASTQNGQDIKETVPDIEGTFTYGYNLILIPGL